MIIAAAGALYDRAHHADWVLLGQHRDHRPFLLKAELNTPETFFCAVQFHREPTYQPFQLGDPLLLGTALPILLKDERGAFEKLRLPTGQHLRVELVLPTQFGCAVRSTQQVEDELRFELGCKGSALCHGEPPSWS